MNIITEMEQGTDEWLALRLGKITASRMKELLSKGRGTAPSKIAESYMFDLIAEKLTGKPKDFFMNDAMQWGVDTEESARAMYELKHGVDVVEVAFIELDENVGMSPDGLVGDDGLLEIKCPNTTTQLKRALTDNYSKDYYAQIQMQLWVSDRQWCDFVSYDPRLECDASYLEQRVLRDEDFIEDMKAKTEKFIVDMNEILNKLKG